MVGRSAALWNSVWLEELCVHVELDEGEARPTQYRERLVTKEASEDLLPSDFTFAVIEVMPEWVKDETGSQSATFG